jgi:hypothetical protein
MKKGKYIDYQVLLACLSKLPVQEKNEVTTDDVAKPGNNIFKPSTIESTEITNNCESA